MNLLRIATRIASAKISGDTMDILADLYGVTSVEHDLTRRVYEAAEFVHPGEDMLDSQTVGIYKTLILETFDRVFGTDYRSDQSAFAVDDPTPEFIFHDLLHHAVDPGFLERGKHSTGNRLDEFADELVVQSYQFMPNILDNPQATFGWDLKELLLSLDGIGNVLEEPSTTPAADLIKKAVQSVLREHASAPEDEQVDMVIERVAKAFQKKTALKSPDVEAKLKKWFLLLRKKVDDLTSDLSSDMTTAS